MHSHPDDQAAPGPTAVTARRNSLCSPRAWSTLAITASTSEPDRPRRRRKVRPAPYRWPRRTYRHPHQGGIVSHDQQHDPSTCVDCISQTAYEIGYAACWGDTVNKVLTLADCEGPIKAIQWLRQESEARRVVADEVPAPIPPEPPRPPRSSQEEAALILQAAMLSCFPEHLRCSPRPLRKPSATTEPRPGNKSADRRTRHRIEPSGRPAD